ncbi:diacylglycerol kinase family protein [Salinicoccus sp. ID82-1]|uniref:diacylglycerol kinase n=1 Tax=Salinicoccus TaxID=45669 RepID=UPI0016436E8B|nr:MULTISPECIES: diacylglycerol kinase family protein [Salinicoccus]MCG1008978.1 diacylglycerol kinase family protein [Salinicoccus sp. ID82-1]
MKLLNRFKYAVMGLRWLVGKDNHFIIHFLLAGATIAAGAILMIERIEWLFIVSAIFFVLIAEALNTSIEASVDLTTGEYHPLAKAAKDAGAAAVLLSSLYAVIVALFIFIPYLL